MPGPSPSGRAFVVLAMRPGEHSVIPLLLLSAAVPWEYRCLACDRPAYLDPTNGLWRHYWRVWHGKTHRRKEN